MNYEQLVAPNLDPVVYENGQILLDWYGWCLATVESAFNSGRTGRTAWDEWTNYLQNKHEDRNFPVGSYFPIWFSGYGGAGHVAIAYINANGSMNIWTSPWHHKPYFDTYSSIADLEAGYRIVFVGWSEDIGGTRVISPAPQPVALPYTIESITPKQVRLNKDAHLWNLNYDNFTAIDGNPVADALAGTLVTVVAVLHHVIGYNYYLSDANVAQGYNTLDADDYTPPPPVRDVSELPAGALVIPNSEQYELVKEVGGYITGNQAVNRENERVRIPAGSYFVFNKYFDTKDDTKLLAVNLTKTSGKPGAWINTADNTNELPPEPEMPEAIDEPLVVSEPVTPEPDFATSYSAFTQPKIYVAMANIPVVDLAGTKRVTMPKYSITRVSGTFTVAGVEYARPQSATAKHLWYGIALLDPLTGLPNIELESNVYNAKTTIAERKATHTLKTSDKLALTLAHVKNGYLGFIGFLGKIKPARKNKK